MSVERDPWTLSMVTQLQEMGRDLATLGAETKSLIEWRGRLEGKVESMQAAAMAQAVETGKVRQSLDDLRGDIQLQGREVREAIAEWHGTERRHGERTVDQLTKFLVETLRIGVALALGVYAGRGGHL